MAPLPTSQSQTSPSGQTRPEVAAPDPLDALLNQFPPVPEDPWFVTRVMVRARSQSHQGTVAWGLPRWLNPLPVAALILTTLLGFYFLSAEPSSTAPIAQLPGTPALEVTEDSIEVAELEDLEMLLADLQMDLWINDSTL